MAPPLGSKRGLPSDHLDAGSRVSKPTTTTYKPSRIRKAKALISMANSNCSTRSNLIENVLSKAHGSTSKADYDTGKENETGCVISTEEFPPLPKESTTEVNSSIDSPSLQVNDDKKNGTAPLMAAIKGLLDLTNEYLQKLEEQQPGIGADFLAMRGERVYSNISGSTDNHHHARQDTWAKKAGSQDAGIKVFNLKRQILKSSAPQWQSKEDRWVMIRLGPENEARKAGVFELRQKIQELVSDKSLVSDVWSIPSEVAILAPTLAKAASIMQSKATIDERLGNATVE
ncbi:hypothetical protein EV44_g4280 [Erysiphe necator]|uniref:Uncharacterized protein n=1 Tax=Uncinula necator TaxID=52586 RepID=A0A0B1P3X8_UNCNE|nr:hypothetical protein EV44_g4280 [Erysiphe necator]